MFWVYINPTFLNGHAANDDWWVRRMATSVSALFSAEAWLDSRAIRENDGLLNCTGFYVFWWCVYESRCRPVGRAAVSMQATPASTSCVEAQDSSCSLGSFYSFFFFTWISNTGLHKYKKHVFTSSHLTTTKPEHSRCEICHCVLGTWFEVYVEVISWRTFCLSNYLIWPQIRHFPSSLVAPRN